MATNRAFAYSTNSAITGFTKNGNIVYETSVGSATRELSGSPEGIIYWGGPDEDTYDVIGFADSSISNEGADGASSKVTFWGAPTGVEADFVDLANYLTTQNIGITGDFETGQAAIAAIQGVNGFYCGDYYA